VTMEIAISGGGWRRRASAFDSGDGRRWALAFDGGDGRQLWQQWTIEMAFNGGGGGGVRWRQQRLTAFDGVGNGLRREDERVAQGQAMQQPDSTMRGQEGGATRGRQEMMARQPAGATRQQEGGTTRRQDDKRAAHREAMQQTASMTRGQEGGVGRNKRRGEAMWQQSGATS
jgi:hypothetical protein